MEPPDFWQQALPPKLAERMPRSVKDPDERIETVYVDGQTLRRPIPLIARRRDADGLTLVERLRHVPARRVGGSGPDRHGVPECYVGKRLSPC
jgi:hypothetical protein